MITLRRPTTADLAEFLATQRRLDFTYAAVGATSLVPPPGYNVDHTRARLGIGEAVFTAGIAALRQWRQFQLGWVTAGPVATPIEAGQVIAVWAKSMGLWWTNACRIVLVVDDHVGTLRRFGFAYGTLPGHVESGEERFLVEWDQNSGEVWYDILAFSRPRHWATKVGYPLVRLRQRQFARDSAAAMQAAVQE